MQVELSLILNALLSTMDLALEPPFFLRVAHYAAGGAIIRKAIKFFRKNLMAAISGQILIIPFLLNEDEVGREIIISELFKEIEKDAIFYEESGGGVTFSGGEPTMQPVFLKAALEKCKENEIHTTVDTSGYAPTRIFKQISSHTDLFLFDLKIMSNELHQKYTGASNELIHKNLKWLDENNQQIYIRIPVVPGITDTKENISETINFLIKLENISEINLLPYHRAGEGKYLRFKKERKLSHITPPENGYMKKIFDEFKTLPQKIKIGG